MAIACFGLYMLVVRGSNLVRKGRFASIYEQGRYELSGELPIADSKTGCFFEVWLGHMPYYRFSEPGIIYIPIFQTPCLKNAQGGC
jgi:hypothetical protein